MAETYPNRIYLNAATTDRDHNLDLPGFAQAPTKLASLPTIWDRLAGAGLSHRYYFSDVPFIGLWGVKYLPMLAPFSAIRGRCRGRDPSPCVVRRPGVQ